MNCSKKIKAHTNCVQDISKVDDTVYLI